MERDITDPHDAISPQPTPEPGMDQPDYDLQYVMARRDEVVSRLNADFFRMILPCVRRGPGLVDGEHHVYWFIDPEGLQLSIEARCQLSSTDIMQTPGFRALKQYCDAQGWGCEVIHFYNRTGAVEEDGFSMRFDDDYEPLTQSFQVRIQGRPSGHPLPKRSALEGGR